MQQTLYPMLACAITAHLAGWCGMLHITSIGGVRARNIMTITFTSFICAGLAGAILTFTL